LIWFLPVTMILPWILRKKKYPGHYHFSCPAEKGDTTKRTGRREDEKADVVSAKSAPPLEAVKKGAAPVPPAKREKGGAGAGERKRLNSSRPCRRLLP